MSKWLELYNCNEDPFAIKPLTTSKDMVFYYITPDISEHLDNIIEKKVSGIYGITGMRGVGKTSTLFYIGNKLKEKGEIVIVLRVVENVGKETSSNLLSIKILKELLESLTKKIFYEYNDLFEKYQKLFNQILLQLGMELVEDQLFILHGSTKDSDYELQRKFVIQIFKLLKNNGYITTILVDNLDKFLTGNNQRILMEFLSGGFAQSFFEEIVDEDKAKIILTLSSEVYDYLKSSGKDSQGLNYLTSTLELKLLKDIDALELLKSRFERVANIKFPFDSGAIQILNASSKGILRTLLWDTKYVLQIAAARGINNIDTKTVQRLLKTQDIYKLHENLQNESSDFRNAIVWLLNIIGQTKPNDEKDKILQSLISLRMNHFKRDIPINKPEIIILRKLKIISDLNLEIIDEQFLHLITILEEKNIDFVDWLKWYIKTDFNFKQITSSSDVLQNKLKRLLFYLDKHYCKSLRKYEDKSEKYITGGQVKSFIIKDLKVIIQNIDDLNMGKIEEISDSELIDITGEIIYLFMRMTNTLLYSEKQIIMDFHTYGPVTKLFQNILNKIYPNIHCFENFNKIYYAKRNYRTSTGSEIKDIFIKCKHDISNLTDYLITIIQGESREIADRTMEELIPSIETITTFLRLSTGNWCHLWIEGYSPADLNIILWEEKDTFYTIAIGSESEFKKYFDTVGYVIHAEDIAKSIHLGKVTVDSSVLCSKDVYELIDYGIFNDSEIIIPPTVYADIKYTLSIKTKQNISLAIEALEKKCKEKNISIQKIDVIPSWIEDEVKKIHPGLIGGSIDRFFITWAHQNKMTAIIGDRGNIGDVVPENQTIWLLPNRKITLASWNSMTAIFEFVKRAIGDKTIKYRINEISGKPITLGEIDLNKWKCKIQIFY